MTGRKGRLSVSGDRAVLTFERRLPYPVEVVWSAITDPDERGQWFGETSIDAREGGMIDMVATGPPLPVEKKRMTGRILVWDPPRVLEHEWTQAIVEDSVVRYELQPDGEGTLLRFSHRGLGARNATGFRGGTHAFLDRLEARGKRNKMMYNGSHIAAPDIAVAYHSGFGHTAALERLLARLGLGAGWNNSGGSEKDLNRLGFWLGAGAQTDVDVDADRVHPSDVATCRHLGQRVALITRQLNLGRAASSPAASSAPVR